MKVLSKKTISAGKWISLDEIEYESDDGIRRKWESVSRTTAGGAVLVVCRLVPSGDIVVIRQFRPPAGDVILEFPAGLLEKGERPETAAVRELGEETGYKGKVLKVLPPSFSSPGLTSEQIYFALAEAPDTAKEELRTHFDEAESIETLPVPSAGLLAFLEAEMGKGVLVDSKLLAYAAGLAAAEKHS